MKTKPFDIEEFKRGELAVTEDGRLVKFVARVPEVLDYSFVGVVLRAFVRGHIQDSYLLQMDAFGNYGETSKLKIIVNDLLPCPFCGNKKPSMTYGQMYRVECHFCNTKASAGFTEDEARDKWNRRTDCKE